jgi:hypothetical protein
MIDDIKWVQKRRSGWSCVSSFMRDYDLPASCCCACTPCSRIEAEIMLHLRGHPNVVEFFGLFEDEDNIHIVEEMCKGGDLYTCVEVHVSHVLMDGHNPTVAQTGLCTQQHTDCHVC